MIDVGFERVLSKFTSQHTSRIRIATIHIYSKVIGQMNNIIHEVHGILMLFVIVYFISCYGVNRVFFVWFII